jgi:hypothetical protein
VNAVFHVLALVDRRAQRVELGELPAVLVWNEEMDSLEAIGEAFRDPRAQRVEPFAREGRDLHRVGEAIREPAATQSIDGVDLVDHHLERQIVGTDVVQHASDGSFLLLEPLIRS